jgi:phage-related protein
MDNPEKLATQGTQDTRRRQTKQKLNTICVGHHYEQTNTNNLNKTLALLQTTGGKDEQNIVFLRKS